MQGIKRSAFALICEAQYRDSDIDFELHRRHAMIVRQTRRFFPVMTLDQAQHTVAIMRVAHRRNARAEIDEKVLAARPLIVKVVSNLWNEVKKLWREKAHSKHKAAGSLN